MRARRWTVEEVHGLGVRTDLETAGSILSVGRTKAYELARRGEFPTPVLKVGNKYVVPLAPIIAALALDAQDEDTEAAS